MGSGRGRQRGSGCHSLVPPGRCEIVRDSSEAPDTRSLTAHPKHDGCVKRYYTATRWTTPGLAMQQGLLESKAHMIFQEHWIVPELIRSISLKVLRHNGGVLLTEVAPCGPCIFRATRFLDPNISRNVALVWQNYCCLCRGYGVVRRIALSVYSNAGFW